MARSTITPRRSRDEHPCALGFLPSRSPRAGHGWWSMTSESSGPTMEDLYRRGIFSPSVFFSAPMVQGRPQGRVYMPPVDRVRCREARACTGQIRGSRRRLLRGSVELTRESRGDDGSVQPAPRGSVPGGRASARWDRAGRRAVPRWQEVPHARAPRAWEPTGPRGKEALEKNLTSGIH